MEARDVLQSLLRLRTVALNVQIFGATDGLETGLDTGVLRKHRIGSRIILESNRRKSWRC